MRAPRKSSARSSSGIPGNSAESLRGMTRDPVKRRAQRLREYAQNRERRKTDPAFVAKATAATSKWLKRNPEKTKAYYAKYRLKFKERYKNDPELRAKVRATNARWEKRHPEQALQIHRNLRKSRRAWLDAQKVGCGCLRCGESDPACLDFHHRDPKQKLLSLAEVGGRSWAIAKMQAEIAKCDLICANCHRKEHRYILRASKSEREQYYA